MEDSELYDTTSVSEDEEEYVPDTNSDTEDSDATIDPKQRTPRFLDDLLSDLGSESPTLCDTTTPELDINCIASEIPVEEGPCSSQDTNDSVVVGACQNKNGNRVYNKRHYCMYCSKPYAKMARHLQSAHQDKADVASALSFPKGSNERKKQLDYIRNRGNYVHNATVM